LPEARKVNQTEAWQIIISWAQDYHICKTKHAYLSGWVAGQVNVAKQTVAPTKKKRWFGF
jgi:erythromycin esterase-like protein